MLVVHVGATYVELLVLSQETWWQDTRTCWIPHPWVQEHSTLAEGLYIGQLIVWVYTCMIHRFFDERRKDYFVMYAHHVITIALVAGSYYMLVLRIGILVLYVHDVSDIFVDVLKMVNFLKLEDRRGWFASEIAYVACVCAWVYWRLYQLPFRVIKGAFIDSKAVLAGENHTCTGIDCMFPPNMPGFLALNSLLWLLQLLHIYWAHLFFMLGYRIVTESAREASRQEYEGDSDDETVNDIVSSRQSSAGGSSARSGVNSTSSGAASGIASRQSSRKHDEEPAPSPPVSGSSNGVSSASGQPRQRRR